MNIKNRSLAKKNYLKEWEFQKVMAAPIGDELNLQYQILQSMQDKEKLVKSKINNLQSQETENDKKIQDLLKEYESLKSKVPKTVSPPRTNYETEAYKRKTQVYQKAMETDKKKYEKEFKKWKWGVVEKLKLRNEAIKHL